MLFIMIIIYNISRGDYVKSSNKSKFPKNFFQKSRHTITFSESIKNYKHFKWSDEVIEGKSKVEIKSLEK